MTLLTTRDRIAIVTITVIIILGWGIRYYLDSREIDPITVHRNAVPVPEKFTSNDVSQYDESRLFAPININSATADELTVLPMIGSARAQAIVSFRDEHGPFDSPDQLTEVPGIGPAIVTRIRNDITVTPYTKTSTVSDSTIFSEK